MDTLSTPLRFDLLVGTDGRIEFSVPYPAGSQVTVLVADQTLSESADLLGASASSTEFWDNAYDDEDWNNA